MMKSVQMARHHSRLQKALDLKPKAFALFCSLSRDSVGIRRALSFYPDFDWPQADRVKILDVSRHHFALFKKECADSLALVSEENRDVMISGTRSLDADSALRVAAEIDDVIVPGHTLTPVDPATGRQIDYVKRDHSFWHFAYPAPAGLQVLQVAGPTVSIPPYKHYGHMLTDVLMPIFHALSTRTRAEQEPITFITNQNPLPVVESTISGLSKMGLVKDHIRLRPWQSIRTEKYLYCRSHCANAERIFSTPEALPIAKECFRRAYGQDFSHPLEPTARLYLTRGATRLRQVAGEAKLIELLKRLDFEIFEASHANHSEQIKRFSQAKTIVGVHGAGLANVLWAGPQSKLLEIMASNARKSTGLHWAAETGAAYVPLLGSTEGDRQSFLIDPYQIASRIEEHIRD